MRLISRNPAPILPGLLASGLAMGLVISSWAGSLPVDLAIDPTAEVKTQVPKVVPNSGRLHWKPHHRDLSPWPTLSYQDARPTPEPRQVTLAGPLNGDAARGKVIAAEPRQGNCVACHQLPGDEWPGSVGNFLLQYRRFGYQDAQIYQQIFDPRVNHPNSVMPAFGTFGILSDQDIRDLVAYLQSLN